MATREIITLSDGSTRYKYKIRRKQPDGTYLTRVRQFRTDTAGKRWARSLEAQIDDGKQIDTRRIEQRALSDLIARYRREVVSGYDATEQRRRLGRLAWWEGHLGTLKLSALRRAHLLECLGKLELGESPSGRPLSPATRKRYIATIQHVFSMALRWEWVEVNPAARLARPGKDRESPGRVRFLSDDERDRLLKACGRQRNRLLAPLVHFALLTGCRQGELLGLRWSDIDWHRRQLALIGDDGARKTKNRHGRSVALTDTALGILRDLKRVRSVASDLVFANGRGVARFPREAFERAVREAEIEDFRFHDLRHTFASYLLMSGATLPELADALGHRTLAMVKRYAHLSRSHAASVVDRMEQRLRDGGGFG